MGMTINKNIQLKDTDDEKKYNQELLERIHDKELLLERIQITLKQSQEKQSEAKTAILKKDNEIRNLQNKHSRQQKEKDKQIHEYLQQITKKDEFLAIIETKKKEMTEKVQCYEEKIKILMKKMEEKEKKLTMQQILQKKEKKELKKKEIILEKKDNEISNLQNKYSWQQKEKDKQIHEYLQQLTKKDEFLAII